MRRFTLLFVAAVVSVASFAQQRSGKAFLSQLRAQRTTKMAQLSGLSQVRQRANTSSAFAQAFANHSSLAKRAGARKAGASTPYEEGKFSYAFSSSYEYIKGFGLTTIPLDSTLVYSKLSKDSIFVDLLSKGWGFIGAKVYPSSVEGYDSLVFEPGQVVGTLKDGTKLSIYNATYMRGMQGLEFSRTDDPIIAYYEPESGTIVSDGAWGVFAGKEATESIDSCYRIGLETMGMADSFKPYSGTRTLAYKTKTDTKDIDVLLSTTPDEEGNETTTFYVRGLSYAAADLGDWQSLTLSTTADGKSPMLVYSDAQYLPNEYLAPVFSYPGTAAGKSADSLAYVGTFNNDSTQLTFTPMDEDGAMLEFLLQHGELYYYQYPQTISSFTINFPKKTTAIRGIRANATGNAREEYFDLTGRRVGEDYKGLVIRRTVDASGKMEVKKVIRN